MARKHRNKGPLCPNCGTELRKEFEFCPKCGQENHDLRVPFRTFAYEFIESITHFDTKLWNTLKVIFTKPGLLTKDFVEGKRARYVHPARFYVFVSVIFFTLLTIYLDRSVEEEAATTEDKTEAKDLRRAQLHNILSDSAHSELDQEPMRDALRKIAIPIDDPHYTRAADRLREASVAVVDSLLQLVDEDDSLVGTRAALVRAIKDLPVADSLSVSYSVRLNGITRTYPSRAYEQAFREGNMDAAKLDSILGPEADSVGWLSKRMLQSYGRMNTETRAGRQQLVHLFVKSVSVIMFILMPFTAVLLLWIFFRKRYYWEHLIFSVHIHTIYFLFFSLLVLFALIPSGEWHGAIYFLVWFICWAYLLLALRRVYGKRWISTLVRFLVMAVPYFFIFFMLLLVGLLLGFFSL
jgi:Protein of unknown function (DUF3667)/zinc-ribbon domain